MEAVAVVQEEEEVQQQKESEFMDVAEVLAAQAAEGASSSSSALASSAFAASLVERFVSAQVLEQRGDAAQAAAAYENLIADYFEARAPAATVTSSACAASASSASSAAADSSAAAAAGLAFDEVTSAGADAPPAPLVVSVALNSLGGFLLDDGELGKAKACFLRSLEIWPRHGMALVNLGDLERENGSREQALEHYAAAAALLPCSAQDGEEEGEESVGEESVGEEESEEEEEEVSSESGDGEGYGGGGTSVPAWFASWVAAPRAEAVALASYMQALHLHQSLQFRKARSLLRRFRGVNFRVAPTVWRTVSEPIAPPRALLSPSEARDYDLVRRFDSALPKPLLRALQRAFSPASQFWVETDYKERGYFSFWHDLSGGDEPSNLVEVLARHLLPITGCADRIVGAEWWVHTRSERRSIGHQMHFDTEECTLAQGRVLHPLVSTVVYLSGMPAPDANGSLGSTAAARGSADPTVVFDMRVADQTATTASVSHPAQGSVLFFPGDRLHCVCPAGVSSATRKRSRTELSNGGSGSGSGSGGSGLTASENLPQRLTLMIGFWAEDVASEGKRRPLGACGPLPRATRACTWPSSLAIPEALRAAEMPSAQSIAVPRAVPSVVGPWESVREEEGGEEEEVGGEEDQGQAADAAWEGRLELPEARNHRFFVSGLEEFRQQLC